MHFICRILVHDDVNSEDLFHREHAMSADNPDAALEVLKTRCMTIVRDDLKITSDGRVSLAQLIVAVTCCEMATAFVLDLSEYPAPKDPTFRSWDEHL